MKIYKHKQWLFVVLISFGFLFFQSCDKDEVQFEGKCLSCIDDNGRVRGGGANEVSAVIRLQSEVNGPKTYNAPYDFYTQVLGNNAAEVVGPDQNGKYNLTLTFTELNPYREIVFSGLIDGEGNYFSSNSTLQAKLEWTEYAHKPNEVENYYLVAPGTTGSTPATRGNATLRVTSFTEDSIKGTFSANLYNERRREALIDSGKYHVALKRK